MSIGNMKLGVKIGAGFALLIGFSGLIGLIASLEIKVVSKQGAAVHAHALEMEKISDLKDAFSEMIMAENDHLAAGDTRLANAFDEQYKGFERTFRDIENDDWGAEETSAIAELKTLYAAVRETRQKLFSAKEAPADTQASRRLRKNDVESRAEIKLLTEQLHGSIKKDMDAFLARSAAATERLLWTIIIVIASAMVLGIAVSIKIVRGVTVPIKSLVRITRLVAESGDLTQDIPAHGSDEIGELSLSFQSMIENLRNSTRQTGSAVNRISSASAEILAASQQEAAAAQEQSSAVAETTAAATELSKSAEMVGENIKRVAQVTNHTLAGMAKIREAIDRTGKIVSALSEKSQKIGKITEVIDDVADQTNLLAVNAAIEAARAGEHGAGFTVVADEIRKLSDSTAKSTKDITDLIELIQHEVSNAIAAMEQSSLSVEEEVKLAQESADRAREISMSVTQQVGGSKQIADAMTNINDAMKQIAAGAQQAQIAAKQLNELGGELKKLTARFIVKPVIIPGGEI